MEEKARNEGRCWEDVEKAAGGMGWHCKAFTSGGFVGFLLGLLAAVILLAILIGQGTLTWYTTILLPAAKPAGLWAL